MGQTPIPLKAAAPSYADGIARADGTDHLARLEREARHRRSRLARRRRRAHAAVLELTYRRELELGMRRSVPPPKPEDALRSVTRPTPGGLRPSTGRPTPPPTPDTGSTRRY